MFLSLTPAKGISAGVLCLEVIGSSAAKLQARVKQI